MIIIIIIIVIIILSLEGNIEKDDIRDRQGKKLTTTIFYNVSLCPIKLLTIHVLRPFVSSALIPYVMEASEDGRRRHDRGKSMAD